MGGNNYYIVIFLLSLIGFLFVDAGVTLTGVNLSGAEWGSNIPGSNNHDYVWSGPADAKYFVGKGYNVFRVPFLWERMQPIAGGDLDASYLSGLQTLVDYLTSNQRYILIDPHNYGRGFGGIIGQSSTSITLYSDLWFKLASQFKNNSYVIFGLMNEPHDQSVKTWKDAAQAAINAIRYTGATNLITVPGIDYTGAWTWGNNNAPVMIEISDPLNYFVFEVHQYLDSDSSGSKPICVNATIGSSRLEYFTNWARQNKRMGFLGEFGAGPNTICEDALSDMTTYMDANSDVWFAWTYWAGGPWWNNYWTDISPNATGVDKPQIPYLQPHIAKETPLPPTLPTPTGSYTPPSSIAKTFAIYENGALQNSFVDQSWGHHLLNNTEVTFNNSQYSISAILSNYGALWFKCDACVDSSYYFALEFYVNPGTNGSLGQLDIFLINGTTKVWPASNVFPAVPNYIVGTNAPNTWAKASIPLGWSPQWQYDGLQIAGNVNGPIGEVYFDQIQFVAYPDGNSYQKSVKPDGKSAIQVSH